MSRRGTVLAGWSAALVLAAAFAWLGLWQSDRATGKARMLEDVGAVLTQRVPVPLATAGDPARSTHYDWAVGRGRFLATPPLLLDNQQREGRVGVRAYAAFQPERGAPLLVDLGWLAFGEARSLPRVDTPPGGVEVRGLLAPPPSAGLRMGTPMAAQAGKWLAVRLEPEAAAAALGLPTMAPRVLRLDPALAFGYPRDLVLLANTLPPERHRGYAVQWFGLAATTLVIALVLTFRRSRR